MNPDPRADPSLNLETIRHIDDVCTIFEEKWRGGARPIIEDLLAGSVGLERSAVLRELLAVEIELRLRDGEQPSALDYARRFPQHRGLVDFAFREAEEAASDCQQKCDASTAAADLPRTFGDYQLLEEIARGGMGIVYKARQVSLDRIVAVKMILAGQLASDAEVERFCLEAQAAAQLEHPNIVPIIEVGQLSGQRYFSMGFVHGVSLASRLTASSIAPREAAELLVLVANAVHYAHERGIVHRDLKPANILLDANNCPHVTDFGLAKRVSDDSGLTNTGQTIGTPSFMPPEQASGDGKLIGPASDVYSLGAVLFTMLTGRPPFQAANTLDTLKQVLEQEPVSPRKLNGSVPRDIETVCLKCLEKETKRRYATARELAEELGRCLAGKPIRARPAGRAERLWRWSNRQPLVATLLAAVLILLIGGTTISTYFAIQARNQASAAELSAAIAGRNEIEERKQRVRAESAEQHANSEKARAEVQTATAQGVSNFMVGMIQGADPIGMSRYRLGGTDKVDVNTTALELLDRAAEKIRKDLGDQPELQAKLMQTIGDVYASVFKFGAAEELLDRSLQIRREQFGNVHAQVADSLHSLSVFHFLEGDFEGAESLGREALAMRRQLLGEQHLDVAQSELNLAWHMLFRPGARGDEAEALMRSALKKRLAHLGPSHREVGLARFGLAFVLLKAGKPTLALQEASLAQTAVESVGGDNRASHAMSYYLQAVSAQRLNHPAEATKYLEQALEQIAALFGEAHPITNYLKCELADAQVAGHDDRTAERIYRETLATNRRVLGDRPFVARSMESLAQFLCNHGRFDEAEQLLDEAVKIHSGFQENECATGALLSHARYVIAVQRDDFREALTQSYKEFQIYRKLNPAFYGGALWDCAFRLSSIAIHEGNLPLYRQACQALVDSRQDSAGPTIADLTALTCAWVPNSLDDPRVAVEIAREALAADSKNPWFERALGATLYRAGRIDESIEHLNRSVEIDGHGGHVSVWIFLAMAHRKAGHAEQARVMLANARKLLVDRIPELANSEPLHTPLAESRSAQPLNAKGIAGEPLTITPLVWQDRAVLKCLFLEADSVVGNVGH